MFITSDYPHGPYPKTTKYSKKDIYKLPYHKGNVKNHMPGYYKNIADDNIQLGKILKMVDTYGLRNNSMFIYASDHGMSGKWGLSEQGLKVPFIVRWPNHIQPNTTSNTLLTFVDVLPTLLEASGSTIPKKLDGKSFFKTLKGNEKDVHQYIYGVATKQNIRACTRSRVTITFLQRTQRDITLNIKKSSFIKCLQQTINFNKEGHSYFARRFTV